VTAGEVDCLVRQFYNTQDGAQQSTTFIPEHDLSGKPLYPEIKTKELPYGDGTAPSIQEPVALAPGTNVPKLEDRKVAADQGLNVCNNHTGKIRFAIGYKDTADWVSQGWWTLAIGECANALAGELKQRYLYLYAEDLEKGGGWGGKAMLCVQDTKFTIKDYIDCERHGNKSVGFFEVDTGNVTSWKVTLSGEKTANALAP
jgi:uncharacterized membrane protein